MTKRKEWKNPQVFLPQHTWTSSLEAWSVCLWKKNQNQFQGQWLPFNRSSKRKISIGYWIWCKFLQYFIPQLYKVHWLTINPQPTVNKKPQIKIWISLFPTLETVLHPTSRPPGPPQQWGSSPSSPEPAPTSNSCTPTRSWCYPSDPAKLQNYIQSGQIELGFS